MKEEEFVHLSELIGPKGIPFDNDDVLEDDDDEDLKSDPVSQMDMKVCVSWTLFPSLVFELKYSGPPSILLQGVCGEGHWQFQCCRGANDS